MTLDQHPLGLLVLLALLSLLPLIAITTTSYLKISVVLILVRNALGVQQAPSTMALNAIAFAVTMFVMAPTFNACLDAARETAPSQTLNEHATPVPGARKSRASCRSRNRCASSCCAIHGPRNASAFSTSHAAIGPIR